MRLLLVEDDTMIGEVVLDLLRAEHYAVDWVKDGDMADTALQVTRLLKNNPHVIDRADAIQIFESAYS